MKPVAFLDLVLDYVKEKTSRLYTSFERIWGNLLRVYAILADHEARLVVLERNLPHCSVKRTTDQSIPNAVATTITWEAIDWDNYNMWDAVNPTRITFKVAGWYNIGTNHKWDSSVGVKIALIRKNGATDILVRLWTSGAVAIAGVYTINRSYYFAQGDYIELIVQQSSGAPVPILAVSDYSPRMWATMEQAQYNRDEIPNRAE